MANRYWSPDNSGTGTWDGSTTTQWATASGGAGGASAPTTSDAVIFDASSGSGTVTIGTGAVGLTLVMTGFTGTLAFGTNSISLAGNNATIFTGAATYSVTGTPLIILTYAGATGTRTFAGGTTTTEANSISVNVTGGTDTFQFGGSSVVRSVDLTGFAGNYVASTTFTVYGNYKLSTGLTLSSSGGEIIFAATSGTKLITSNGQAPNTYYTFNGVGGTWQFQDALTIDSQKGYTLTNGTLDLNGKTITGGSWFSNNGNTRAVVFNGGALNLTRNGAAIWQMATATGFTYTGTPTVNCTYSGATGTRTFQHGSTAGGTEANAPNFNVTAGTDIITVTAGSKLGNFIHTGFAGTYTPTAYTLYGNLTLAAGATYSASASALTLGATSGTKTITSNGQTVDFPITVSGGATYTFADALTQGATRAFTFSKGTIKFKSGVTTTVGAFATSGTTQKSLLSTTGGSQATLSQASGSVTVTYLNLQDSAATGGATFTATGTGNVNFGNNSGWSLPPFVGALSRGCTLSMGIRL